MRESASGRTNPFSFAIMRKSICQYVCELVSGCQDESTAKASSWILRKVKELRAIRTLRALPPRWELSAES